MQLIYRIFLFCSLPLIASGQQPDWYPLASGIGNVPFNEGVFTIAILGDDIYVGGNFLDAGGDTTIRYLARWDGCAWHSVLPELNGPVRTIETNGATIYIGGEFTEPFSHIGYWNGTQWSGMSAGLDSTVMTIAIGGSNVYAGGSFTNAGGNASGDYVAGWDGTAWFALGSGLNDEVWDMEWDGYNLYVGGWFTNAGDIPAADAIAFWTGSEWAQVGNQLEGILVWHIELYQNQVYAAGFFTVTGGQPDEGNLAYFDNGQWHDLNGGSGSVDAMLIYASEMYTMFFTSDCQQYGIYHLNTQTWEYFPFVCFYGLVTAFAHSSTDLYVGGLFFMSDEPPPDCPECINIVRYGEPAGSIAITGVPQEICHSDTPIQLPVVQSGYEGLWSGPGVVNNVFDPALQAGDITLIFTPNNAGCISEVEFVISVINCAFPPIDWKWGRAISGDPTRGEGGSPYVYDITVDSASNASYTVGYFYGSVDFNPGPGEYSLSPLGANDGFIVKLDADGGFLWAKQIGGSGSSVILYALTTDPAGNLFITGGFSGGVDFDPDVGVQFKYSYGEGDVFILKLNAAGQFQWVKQFGYPGSTCRGANIAIDRTSGNIYSTGTHRGLCDFDPGSGTYILGSNDQEYNIFISKLDNNGDFVWAKEVVGPTTSFISQGTSIAVDAQNESVYTCGQFYGTCDFDTGPGVLNLTSSGDADIFLLKLDSAGNFVWVNQIGGSGKDCCPSVALGKSGEEKVYIAGAFSGEVDFDPGPGVVNLTGNGELFISKLDSAGDLIWAKALGSSAGVNTYSGSYLSVDSIRFENVTVSGSFYGMADFDPGPASNVVSAVGGADIYVARMDSTGDFLFVKTTGGLSNDAGIASAIDKNGDILLAGNYASSILPFGMDTLENVSEPNSFVAKAGGCSALVTAVGDEGPGTLRDVIACAQSGDRIEFALPPMSQITLTSGEIIIDKNLTLAGPGVNALTLSGNNTSRIFNLFPGRSFRLENIALKNGYDATLGGAIYSRGILYLKNVLLENNYQSLIPKSLTLMTPGSLHNEGLVQMRY